MWNGILFGSVQTILTDNLCMNFIAAKFIPTPLTLCIACDMMEWNSTDPNFMKKIFFQLKDFFNSLLDLTFWMALVHVQKCCLIKHWITESVVYWNKSQTSNYILLSAPIWINFLNSNLILISGIYCTAVKFMLCCDILFWIFLRQVISSSAKIYKKCEEY